MTSTTVVSATTPIPDDKIQDDAKPSIWTSRQEGMITALWIFKPILLLCLLFRPGFAQSSLDVRINSVLIPLAVAVITTTTLMVVWAAKSRRTMVTACLVVTYATILGFARLTM